MGSGMKAYIAGSAPTALRSWQLALPVRQDDRAPFLGYTVSAHVAVLLVGHSWGGAVITEAGNHAQVKGIVYVAAGAPDSGQSFGDWWKDYTPAPAAAEIKPYGEGYVALTPEGVRKHFVQDIPAEEADIVYATQGPLAARCFSDKVSVAAWRSKRSWYIVAAQDETIPPAVERDSANRMGAETLVLQSSHVPMLSQPEAVAEFIASAAATVAG